MTSYRLGRALLAELAVLAVYYSLRYPFLPREIGNNLQGKIIFNFGIPIFLAAWTASYVTSGTTRTSVVWNLALFATAIVLSLLSQLVVIYVGCGVSGVCF